MELQTTRAIDLLLAFGVCASATLAAVVDLGWLRLGAGALAVLVVPGYLLAAILFPGRHEPTAQPPGISPLERTALSLALSLAVAPAAVLLVNFTPWGMRTVPVLAALTTLSAASALLALRKRQALPVERRPLFRLTIAAPRFHLMTKVDRALVVLVVASAVVASGAVAYSITTPREPTQYTEFYVLGPGRATEDYPRNLFAGEEGRVIIGIQNHESRRIDYDVKIEATRLGPSSQQADPTAPERIELGHYEWTLEHDETREEMHPFRLQEPGDYRVQFTLRHSGDEQPYRSVHFDVAVMPGG